MLSSPVGPRPQPPAPQPNVLNTALVVHLVATSSPLVPHSALHTHPFPLISHGLISFLCHATPSINIDTGHIVRQVQGRQIYKSRSKPPDEV